MYFRCETNYNMTEKRRTWGDRETRLLLDLWGEDKI